MKKVILTKGLQASGKTTWAKEQLKKYPGRYKRVNRDELRLLFDNEQFNPKREKFITKAQHSLIFLALEQGFHVIVDDTNLNPKTVNRLTELVKGKAEITFKDFTDISLDECIRRDLKRPNSVGPDIILDFYNKYLKPKTEKIPFEPSLPTCIICDIDGTLAHAENRYIHDLSKVYTDTLDKNVKELLDYYKSKNLTIIVLSGREEFCREDTIRWLNDNKVPYDSLYMRKLKDHRKDTIVKQELYEEHVKGRYNVKLIFDDRECVVEMWRELGLICYAVAEGKF